jgi:asparagine synthase (glutamine-hydrolysing)
MQLFGFAGPFNGPAFPALLAYGTGQCAPDAPQAWQDAQAQSACWAEDIASEARLTVAVAGQARWRDTGLHASARTVLENYRQAGIPLLKRLTGRFALAVLDGDRTLLAVDPMGIGRLCYAKHGGGIVFGVSAERIARSPTLNAALNRQAIFDYLMMHMVPAPRTIFAGVEKLHAASYAIFEDANVRVERYWTPTFAHATKQSNAELHRDLFTALRSAVRTCAPDARSGAFLSGGLDSSTVAGLLNEATPHAKTFSIGFGYADYDELNYARLANRRFGCSGHEYTIHGNDIVDSFARIARAYDEPFGNSSALPAYYCARLAKQHGVDHLLAGDGGDELFAGNSRYTEQQIFELYQLAPRVLRKGLLEPLLARWPRKLDVWPVRKARGYVEKANIPLPARLETWNVVQRLGATEMLHADFLAEVDTQAPFTAMQAVWDATPSNALLHRMLYYDWQYTLADNDLRKVEAMCALAGVKVSYPMLDAAVVDMSASVPPAVMMPGSKLRHFYKQAVTGFLPDEIIHKKKHGFGLPFGLWLQESAPLRDLIFGNLAALRKRNLIRESFIDRLLNLHGSEDARYYGVFLWVLAMLEQWLQEHRTS